VNSRSICLNMSVKDVHRAVALALHRVAARDKDFHVRLAVTRVLVIDAIEREGPLALAVPGEAEAGEVAARVAIGVLEGVEHLHEPWQISDAEVLAVGAFVPTDVAERLAADRAAALQDAAPVHVGVP